MKLLKMQGGACIYSGKKIAATNFGECEIDHIFPRSMGGNDALYNKVLCYRDQNQLKRERTPYEWLSADEKVWVNYVNRLNKLKQSLGRKKFELLTSSPDDCKELIDSYNGLAETSHIARVAQQITAAIRRRYKMNSFLGNGKEKNRQNDKRHALDAICISYSRDFKYDDKIKKDVIKGFNPENVKKIIDNNSLSLYK